MALSSDDRLGHYVISALLGAGGMGEVYRATDTRLGREVAIKVLPGDLETDPERLRRFEREARAASALNHPNIVTIHDIDEHEGRHYIAMELIEGRTLREILEEGELPLPQIVSLTRQVAEGLAKAHGAGIIHRDLKPENVMVTDDGLVKILDFGLAKLAPRDADFGSESPTMTQTTKHGVLLGTVPYMSPEQAAGRSRRPVVRSVLLRGHSVRDALRTACRSQGTSAATVLSAILRDTPAEPRKLRPGTPKELGIGRRPLPREGTRTTIRVERRSERGARSLRGSITGFHCANRTDPALEGGGGADRGAGNHSQRWSRGFGSAIRAHAGYGARRCPRSHASPNPARLYEAYRLALEAGRYLSEDSELRGVLDRITLPISLITNPPGCRRLRQGIHDPRGALGAPGPNPPGGRAHPLRSDAMEDQQGRV